MALFQKPVLNKYLKLQDAQAVEKAYRRFTDYFHNSVVQQNIKESKEEQFQQKFLIELFDKVFGYTIFPDENSNLTTEFKNLKGAKKADGAILVEGKAIAVIELKGTKTKDLESIRQQAFDYKSNHPGCVYIITSNFEKLRFYVNSSDEYVEFNLFTLTLEEFKLMYLCLHKEKIFSNTPLKIKEESIREEENITKKFYADYSIFKRELYRDLVKLNSKNDVFRAELIKEDADRATKNIKLTLFKKSQKLIDRFLFIFFGEDRGLLPPNFTIKILEDWNKLKAMDAVMPLYNRFKLYFNFLDKGRQGIDNKSEIFAYNGGLFKPDPVLDSMLISDELLYKHTKELSHYNFDSQIDVNILGHIFENSLNEIESVNAEIEGVDFDKQTTKRKKDGVFYTPKYITKYIVDNTVGKLCTEKKTELGILEEEYFKSRKGRTTKKLKELQQLLNTYRDWLLTLTILDPACGSGAFLNQALDYLIKEHQYIDELDASLTGHAIVFRNIENTVLEKNIYGVDLNEESIEIAKLSLWLRTAQPRRQLTTLSSNIKCGNSLIDDPKVAGTKAFNWQKEFPEIFAKGGFDVVIGNPPYVQIRNLPEMSILLAKLGFETFEKMGDLYCLFYEQGVNILNKGGLLGYITSNTWMRSNYGTSLRKFLSNFTNPLKLFDLGSGVFDSATVDSNILILQKNIVKTYHLEAIDLTNESKLDSFDRFLNNSVVINEINREPWVISNPMEKNIRTKVEDIGIPLENWEINIYRGVQTGNNDVFLIDEIAKKQLISEDSNAKNIIYPILYGKDLTRYNANFKGQYLIYTTSETDLKCYPSIEKYLFTHKSQLDSKVEVKQGKMAWYSLYRPARKHFDEFFKDKIIFSKASKEQSFYLDNGVNALALNTSYIATGKDITPLVAILNSKFIRYCFINFYQSGGISGEITIQSIERIPIPRLSDSNHAIFEKYALLMSSNFKNLKQAVAKFIKYIQSKFSLETLPKKLQNWHKLDFGEFTIELNKVIKKAGGAKLSKTQEMDWMEVFETKKAEAQTLKAEIDKTDAEIDRMVYELYNLTEEEIKIVESN